MNNYAEKWDIDKDALWEVGTNFLKLLQYWIEMKSKEFVEGEE